MFTPSYRHLLIVFLLLVAFPKAQAEEQGQGVMSDLRDAIVESEWGQKKKRQFDELKDKADERFVQPVARWRAQLECSAGWRGDECEKMFPETRERVGRSLESLQDRASSVARSARDLPARLEEEAVEARSGMKRLLETDAEKMDRVNKIRELALIEARKEDERINARSAQMLAEQQQLARKFAEDQAWEARERERAAEKEREALAQHETEVDQAVGLFLNILGAAAAQSARSQTYAPAPRPAQTYQAPQQTYQTPQPTYNRPSGGGSGGGSSSYCYKEEGINGRYVCR